MRTRVCKIAKTVERLRSHKLERIITMINRPVLYQLYPSYEDMTTARQRSALEDHILDCHYLLSGREVSELPCKIVHSASSVNDSSCCIDIQFLMNGRWQKCHVLIPNRSASPVFGPGFRANRMRHVCYEGLVPNRFVIRVDAKAKRRTDYEGQWPAAAA